MFNLFSGPGRSQVPWNQELYREASILQGHEPEVQETAWNESAEGEIYIWHVYYPAGGPGDRTTFYC